MATNVYLGYPPPNVMAWIEEEQRKKKTIITFDDESTEEYEWTGEVNRQTLEGAGIYDSWSYEWLKKPVSIQFGTTVTTVGEGAFDNCYILASVSMPNVQTVGEGAFSYCENLASVSMPNVQTVGNNAFYYISTSAEFENQTTETIESWFGNDVFGLDWSPCTITCSNGSVYAFWNNGMWNITITPA